jgi:hypothetical protein
MARRRPRPRRVLRHRGQVLADERQRLARQQRHDAAAGQLEVWYRVVPFVVCAARRRGYGSGGADSRGFEAAPGCATGYPSPEPHGTDT